MTQHPSIDCNFQLQINGKQIARVNPVEADHPWGEMLLAVSKFSFPYLASALNAVNAADLREVELARQAIEENYAAAACWVYKKLFNPKYKLPMKRGFRESSEVLADRLAAYCEMCDRLHRFAPRGRYRDAAEWLDLIVIEQKVETLHSFFEPAGKEACAKQIRKDIKALRGTKNPYDPQATPHLYYLIDLVLEMNRRKYYGLVDSLLFRGSIRRSKYGDTEIKGLVQTLTAEASYMERSGGDLLKIKDGSLVAVQRGRQKPKQLLTLPVQAQAKIK